MVFSQKISSPIHSWNTIFPKVWKRFWNLKAIFPKRYLKKFFRIFFQIKLLFRLIKIAQNISQNLRPYSPKYFGKFRVAWSCRVLCQEHLWTLFSACFWDMFKAFPQENLSEVSVRLNLSLLAYWQESMIKKSIQA